MQANETLVSTPGESSTTSLLNDAFIVIGMVLGAAGLIINIATLSVVSRVHLRVQWLRMLLGSLCVADILLSVATLGLLSWRYHETSELHAGHANTTYHRNEYCAIQVFQYVWDMSSYANLLTLVAMAVQLFVSVRWPLHSSSCLSSSATALALALIWLSSTAMSFAPAVIVATSVDHENLNFWYRKADTLFCYQLAMYNVGNRGVYKYQFGQESHERSRLIFELVMTVLILTVLIATYSYIYCVVRSKRKRFNTNPNSQPYQPGLREERRLMIFASLATVLFLLCYLPLYSFHIVMKFQGLYMDGSVFPLLMTLVALAPIGDPLLYSLRLEEIRSRFRSMICYNSEYRKPRNSGVDPRIGAFKEPGRELSLPDGHRSTPCFSASQTKCTYADAAEV